MKIIRCRRALLAFIALLLLLPTVILIARAIAVGNFPRKGEAELVRITAPDGAKTTLTPNAPLYGVVHELLTLTDRVLSSSLPSNRETYQLEFVSKGVTERLKLYIARDKDSAGGEYLCCFLLSSEDRLYRVKFPNARILTRILTPSRVDWISLAEDKTLYTYGNTESYLLINLSGWDAITAISLDSGVTACLYRLYDSESHLISETASAAEIEALAPSRVFLTVRWGITDTSAIESTYVFEVGD